MNRIPIIVFSILCLLFLAYSFRIYTYEPEAVIDVQLSKQSSEGKMVWQKYNCQSCHQMYGLGGYLGPDLTNVYSLLQKNETVIEAIIRSGNERMPAYHLNTTEMINLLAFLKRMDESGKADPRSFSVGSNGMIY